VLEPAWSVTAWDLRGHGETERTDNPADYSSDLALADLTQLVTDAGAPVVLGGHSFGGYLSLALAQTRPDFVRALILVATGPGFRNVEAREQWNATITGASEGMQLPAHVLALGHQHDSAVLDNLSAVKVPVLVIVGERDKRFHASTDLFANKLGARVLRVPDAGHHVHNTHIDAVGPVVLDFLQAI
jgi:pimeloyl-ACP methyl ester carboxylesterase